MEMACRLFRLAVFGGLTAVVVACQPLPAEPEPLQPPAAAIEQLPQPQYVPRATVKDLMLSVVDPSADIVWNATRTIVTKDDGVVDIYPETDEEWAVARRGAVVLAEAANMLMIPGRRVAPPGVKSEHPGLELEPEQIAILIEERRNSWSARALVLNEYASYVIDAIDARDPERVYELGSLIEPICESCHLGFWYPGQGNPDYSFDAR